MTTTDNHPAIPLAVWQDIQNRLDMIEAEQRVRLLMVVESGSRAWGFPSPDSDYDIRFVYVRERDWYLQLQPGRDVIEAPIEDEIDLNGWDIRKALGLLMKSNAVISEWIESPIRYRSPHPIVERLGALADAILDARALAHHYASVGRNAAERWLDDDQPVPVKKYFYALRPALAIRFLRTNPGLRPPMHLDALVAASGLSSAVADDIAALVEVKSRTNEAANGMRIPELDALIRSELGRANELPTMSGIPADRLIEADRIFLELVDS
ncbi:MAG: nucleotidyltransferase domain-containing protein [Pseudomonadota bacterium]